MSAGCVHVPTSPGQAVCACVDKLMWTRLAHELACRRIVELETEVQGREPRVVVG